MDQGKCKLKEILPGHQDPLHDTIQDYENNSNGRKTRDFFFWHWEDGRKVPETDVPGQVLLDTPMLTPKWQVAPVVALAVVDMNTAMTATNQSLLSAHTTIGGSIRLTFRS
jgi:hypothetical protein